ncbi:MAG: hypothetical protein H7281_06505 [Bacteriovorax sp.]|nr:hypothetical protein [Bacteriovorax sp.]
MWLNFKKKYSFKLRSLPNENNFGRYFTAYLYLIFAYLAFNFIHICLFSDGFGFEFPSILAVIIPIIFIHIYTSLENDFKKVTKDDLKNVVTLIRTNHYQSLFEVLSTKPEILNVKYKNKSILYWAKYYQNPKANSVIIKVISKQHSNQ